MIKRRSIGTLSLFALAFLVGGCNSDDSPERDGAPESGGSSGGAEAPPRDADRAGEDGSTSDGGRPREKKPLPPGVKIKPKPRFEGAYTTRLSPAQAKSLLGSPDLAGTVSLVLSSSGYTLSDSRNPLPGRLKVSTAGPRLRAKRGRMVFQGVGSPPARETDRNLNDRNLNRKRKAAGLDQATLRDLRRCAKARGVYAWTIRGRRLAFRTISDPCRRRATILGGAAWRKS